MKTLITGGAGLIGSHIAEILLDRGGEVHVIDNFSIGKLENVPEGAKIHKADCQDFEKVSRILQEVKPDTVYHMAAWAHEGLSQFCPVRITDNNYNAHISILTAAIKAGVSKYILGSSMSVYGDQNTPYDEDMKRKPVDIYAISKTAMETSTEVMSKVHGIEYVIIRPHNVYGPRQAMNDPYRNVAGIFINRALQGKPFYIYGDGEQRRAFSHVYDVAPAIVNAQELHGEIINVGPMQEYTINQLAEEVMKHFPNNPEPIHVADRPLEVKDAWCTDYKAKRLLNYKTRYDLEKGVANMVEWAKENGAEEPQYLEELEISKGAPETWVKKLL